MGRKPTFNKNEAIELYAKGIGFREISKILNCKEDAIEKCIKRNVPELVEKKKIKMANRKNLNIKKDDEFELKSTRLLDIKALKEISEARTYGIYDNESIDDYVFFIMNRQSYRYDKKTKKFVFDESRGKRTYAVPSSY